MIVLLLILIPLVGGLLSFAWKDDKAARGLALIVSLVNLAVSLAGISMPASSAQLRFSTPWLSELGSSFTIQLDGMSQLLCLLTAVAYPVIFIATWKTEYKKAHNFFALMLLTQAGLMGVFTAMDALVFYFFWELALIPVYFLCSQWGGERRIQVTFKFFIYTFTGSVLMLIGLLCIYFQTSDQSFSITSFYQLKMEKQAMLMVQDPGGWQAWLETQSWLFWLMFIAFAIKMPVFPFHTWQPDTYEQSPTATTMVLSGIMVKMGLFGLLRWVLPVLPFASYLQGDRVTWMAVIGILYASIIAIQQNDLKRLVAYSSIAHVGLMAAAIFAENKSGFQGIMMQMFNHGINIIGLWIVVEQIERRLGTRKISELGGLAQKAPALAILLVIVALANISLPLTNAFVGEFLMFNGIFGSDSKLNILFASLAGLSIILAAVYTLNMVQKVFYGNTNALTAAVTDSRLNEVLALSFIVLLIFIFGVYPQPLLNLTNTFVDSLLKEISLAGMSLK